MKIKIHNVIIFAVTLVIIICCGKDKKIPLEHNPQIKSDQDNVISSEYNDSLRGWISRDTIHWCTYYD